MAGVIEQTAFARLSRRADVEAVGQFDQLHAREAPPRDLDDDRFGEVREQVAGADMNIRLGRRSHSPPRPQAPLASATIPAPLMHTPSDDISEGPASRNSNGTVEALTAANQSVRDNIRDNISLVRCVQAVFLAGQIWL
jgi:hypothetical protein